MGRRRKKAKTTKTARELKYTDSGTDLARLQAELNADHVSADDDGLEAPGKDASPPNGAKDRHRWPPSPTFQQYIEKGSHAVVHKLQWRYASRPDLGVLALAGQLGASDVPRLNGAIGWTLFHGGGPLILDLSALYRWTALGQDAIVKAAARLQTAGRTLDIAAAPGSDTSVIASASPAIRTHPALIDALTAHSAAAGPHQDQREWRSGGWPETSRDPRILTRS